MRDRQGVGFEQRSRKALEMLLKCIEIEPCGRTRKCRAKQACRVSKGVFGGGGESVFKDAPKPCCRDVAFESVEGCFGLLCCGGLEIDLGDVPRRLFGEEVGLEQCFAAHRMALGRSRGQGIF